MSSPQEALIHVSNPLMLVSMVPLLIIAGFSHYMKLGLEQSVLVGTIRAAVQLTICGWILVPIFLYGSKADGWWIVALYCLFMIFLAAYEASRRSKYYFENMFAWILLSFIWNIGLLSVFSFGLILRPTPVWEPKYVIPIVGMLLGNCINSVALSLDHGLTSLKECVVEMELYLAFGATCHEASSRLLRESIRISAMPLVNSMAVIGLISIPGMMTGQILGGAPVVEAARYQILITYLINICAFGTIIFNVWVARITGCDSKTERMRVERFKLRSGQTNGIASAASSAGRWFFTKTNNDEESGLVVAEKDSEYRTNPHRQNKGSMQLSTIRSGSDRSGAAVLELKQVSFSFPHQENDGVANLFHGISLSVYPGDIVAIKGPSGVGKSQFMRLVASLNPMDNEDERSSDILLCGKSRRDFHSHTDWRREVRYISQSKVDIMGTPRQFVERICGFTCWKRQRRNMDAPPSYDEIMKTVKNLVTLWGLDTRQCLDEEWKNLSGGEAQRVFVAIAIATRPKVLLMDESTASLDNVSKQKVEQSVLEAAALGTCVLWISHDDGQLDRLSQ